MSDAYYTLHIAGLERQLKRFPVSDSMDIAAFIFFGDVELTKACAEALLKKVPEFDYIVTPEADEYSAGLRNEPPKRQKIHCGSQGR